MKAPGLILLVALAATSSPAFIAFSPSPRTGPAAFAGPAVVASNGFDYLAAWTATGPFGSAIYDVRISATGQVDGPIARAIDPSGPFLTEATNPHALSISVGRDGYLLAWASDESLIAGISDSFGVIERKVVTPLPGNAETTAAAWNGSAYAVFVQTRNEGDDPFFVTVIDNNGAVLRANIPVGNKRDDPYAHTAITNDDNGFLIVASKTVADHYELYGRRLTSNGTLGEWFLIRSIIPPVSGLATQFDGSRDVVVWGDWAGIWTIPVDTHLDTAGVARQFVSATVNAVVSVAKEGESLWIGFVAEGKQRIISIAKDGTVSEPPRRRDAGIERRECSFRRSAIWNLHNAGGSRSRFPCGEVLDESAAWGRRHRRYDAVCRMG